SSPRQALDSPEPARASTLSTPLRCHDSFFAQNSDDATFRSRKTKVAPSREASMGISRRSRSDVERLYISGYLGTKPTGLFNCLHYSEASWIWIVLRPERIRS